ncbi:MAG: hypothetical protein Q7U66_04585 [Methylobacter sp.]|nr:hypothetical protein [Methylobacter sp.]
MFKAKQSDEKIVIRGITLDKNYYKPQIFDEYTLSGILNALDEIGVVANTRITKGYANAEADTFDLVACSPLLRIEAMLRYQLMKLGKEHKLIGLFIGQLITPLDFSNAKEFVREECLSCKAVFLFDFLEDIVTFSHYPDQINQNALKKIALNLRALSFLVEPQLTGSEKDEDIGFKVFAYCVWQKIRTNQTPAQLLKKITAQQFWNKAVAILEKNQSEVTLDIPRPPSLSFGIERIDTYAFLLETNKSNKQTIRSACASEGISGGRPKSFEQVKGLWPGWQKEFIKRDKLNSG